MSKCPKCENDKFVIEKREDKNYCYVVCDKCNTVVGVLEDIDFKKKLDIIINNECGLDTLINDRHNEILEKLKEIQEENFNLNEEIYIKIKNLR